jgi:hypothetical protein
MDQYLYLAALGKHDPSGPPVAAGAKMTENTKRVALGDRIRKTMKYMKFRGETISDHSAGGSSLSKRSRKRTFHRSLYA